MKTEITLATSAGKRSMPYGNEEIKNLHKKAAELPHGMYNLNQLRKENERLKEALEGVILQKGRNPEKLRESPVDHVLC